MTTSEVMFTSWHPRTLRSELAGSQPSAEEVREEARANGYAEGYKEGLESGKKEAAAQGNAKAAELQALIDALDQPFQNLELEVSEYLLSLVSAICKSIIRRELSTEKEYIQNTLERALALLSDERGNVKLMLHPDDAALVSDNWSDELGELKIRSVPELIRGGCRIQRNDSLVDATIETQLRKAIVDLSLVPGPANSLGEPAAPLDAENINITAERLEGGVDLDE